MQATWCASGRPDVNSDSGWHLVLGKLRSSVIVLAKKDMIHNDQEPQQLKKDMGATKWGIHI